MVPLRSYFTYALSCLALIPAALLLAGCLPGNSDRQANLQAIARWEDRRLAPEDSLLTMLTHSDAHVRLAAVRAAGLIGRTDVLPTLRDATDDKSTTVRRQALFSLGLLNDVRALPDLEIAARDPRPGIRLAAIDGLAHLENDGRVLAEIGVSGPEHEAAAAWTALRNQIARVDTALITESITRALARPENEVIWRVLRCVERFPAQPLLATVTPFVHSASPQIRVHAYRALGRFDGPDALAAVLDGCRDHDVFHQRHLSRVRIAAARALGALGAHTFSNTADEAAATQDYLAAVLIGLAGQDNGHVSSTALQAMAAAVTDLPLPPEAAQQESLLPVWRIRLARAAKSHLQNEHAGVRAAALTAWADLRGAGAAVELVQSLEQETMPQVLAAGLTAVGRQHPDPVLLLTQYVRADAEARFNAPPRPALATGLVRSTALESLAQVFQSRPESLPDGLPETFFQTLLVDATGDTDFAVAVTAAGLLGDVPGDASLEALLTLWDRAPGDPYGTDIQRGVLAGLKALLTTQTPYTPTDSLRTQAATLLRAGFDAPDIRLRRESRDVAQETELLPDRLIPTLASLRATIPAVVRDPKQPAVRQAYEAGQVRCITNRGTFVINLDGDLAPNTCAVFLDLIERGFYDDLTFHRVVPDFVIQGGDPRGDGWGHAGYSIRSEWSRAAYRRGVVGIAHDGKDSGGCQFFVTLSEQPHLNGRYTVFGEVTRGLDIADGIQVGDTMRLELMP